MTPAPITLNVSEAENPGFEITVVRASDSDEGINKEIVYSLTPGRDIDRGLFNIDSVTGRVTLSRRLGKNYSLFI